MGTSVEVLSIETDALDGLDQHCLLASNGLKDAAVQVRVSRLDVRPRSLALPH